MKLFHEGEELDVTEIPAGTLLIVQSKAKRSPKQLQELSMSLYQIHAFRDRGISVVVAPSDLKFIAVPEGCKVMEKKK
jgi:hypothetical protein